MLIVSTTPFGRAYNHMREVQNLSHVVQNLSHVDRYKKVSTTPFGRAYNHMGEVQKLSSAEHSPQLRSCRNCSQGERGPWRPPLSARMGLRPREREASLSVCLSPMWAAVGRRWRPPSTSLSLSLEARGRPQSTSRLHRPPSLSLSESNRSNPSPIQLRPLACHTAVSGHSSATHPLCPCNSLRVLRPPDSAPG
jgi:hypothetical protein